MPFNSETAHIPVYTHETPNSNFARLDRWRALREEQLIYSSLDSYSSYNTMPWGSYWGSGYWGGGYWGGYWGPSLFFTSGMYCDPFSPYWMWGCYSPYSLLMSNSLYGFYPYPFLGMFPAPFYSFSLYGGLSPYYGGSYFGYPFSSSLFYNAPFSPTVFGSFCPLCTTSNPNFSLFALDNPYLLATGTAPNGSSTSTAAGAASLSSTYNAPANSGLFATGSTAAGEQPSTFNANIPASSQPVSLVFTDGTTAQATQYWVGNGRLHYVTTAGANESVPLSEFDMQATMKANQKNGVRFFTPAPGPKEPAAQHR